MRSKNSLHTLLHSTTKVVGLLVLVFTMGAFVAAQEESTIYNFQARYDGAEPGGLIADSSGNLYGTTYQGGGSHNCGGNGTAPIGCGTVFELIAPTHSGGHWTETLLYVLRGGTTDGVGPSSPLVFDKAGNLYGGTLYGGAAGLGTIFQLTPPAQPGRPWTETVLYSFGSAEGGGPRGLAIDTEGNLYGEANGADSDGQIFELSPPSITGGPWTFSSLYTFTGTNGDDPNGGLILDPRGNLYGATFIGGTNNCGLVFELVKPATQGGTWSENVLYNFTGINGDGAQPFGGVIFHGGNHLYGTTAYGGNDIGDGTVFELSPGSNGWTETTLYQFDRNTGGFRPEAGVVFDHQGNLYSTTTFAAFNGGEVFQLAAPAKQGAPWGFTLLYDFDCATGGGCSPLSTPVNKGNQLYGTAYSGGTAGAGFVYGIIP
jgi:uncharacterized repeat protein (TIGR03803 family)